MKNYNSLLGLMAMASILFTQQAAAIPMVTLEQVDPVVSIGTPFAVDVVVNNIESVDPLLAFGFDIIAPALTVLDVTVGAEFFDDSALFVDTAVAGSAFPAISSSTALLATLVFQANVAGSYDIQLLTDATDFGLSEGLFTVLGTSDVSASVVVDVLPASIVSTPGTLPLLGLALLPLLKGYRIRF